MLLVLDNLEQVIEARPSCRRSSRPALIYALLVTSRELLRVQGEVEYAVPPLATLEAVALFCERSRPRADATRSPSSASVSTSYRSPWSSPPRARRRSRRPRSWSGSPSVSTCCKGGRDADPRQQTLRATIEWSYDLLSDGGAAALSRSLGLRRRLHARGRRGGAEAELDSLQSLVEKSLLRFSSERYWMLETIREFAAAQARPVAEASDSLTSPRALLRPRRGRRRAPQGRRVRARADRGGARQSPRRLRYRARARPRRGARASREAWPLLEPARPLSRRATEARSRSRRSSCSSSLRSRPCTQRSGKSRSLAGGSRRRRATRARSSRAREGRRRQKWVGLRTQPSRDDRQES